MPRPQEILAPGGSALAILWEDGHESFYPGPQLRRHCPCAPCREEQADDDSPLRLVSGGVAPEHRIRDVHPVGTYALGIVWGDGHDTGIWSFDYLLSLCDCESCLRRGESE